MSYTTPQSWSDSHGYSIILKLIRRLQSSVPVFAMLPHSSLKPLVHRHASTRVSRVKSELNIIISRRDSIPAFMPGSIKYSVMTNIHRNGNVQSAIAAITGSEKTNVSLSYHCRFRAHRLHNCKLTQQGVDIFNQVLPFKYSLCMIDPWLRTKWINNQLVIGRPYGWV